MKKRKRIFVKLIRNTETIKTVAIILLMVSCVYFGLLTVQYQNIPGGSGLSFFVWENFDAMSDYSSEPDNSDYHDVIRVAFSPEYITCDNIIGRKVLYNTSDEYAELCNCLNDYVFSIYKSESKAFSEKLSDNSDWTADLKSSEFIYAKLPQSINSNLLRGTEYEGNMISKSLESYDEIIVTADDSENSTIIYFGSSISPEKLKVTLEKSPLSMLNAVRNRVYGAEKECVFGFELKNEEFADYAVVSRINALERDSKLNLNPMLIIPVSTMYTPVITLSVPENYLNAFNSVDNSDVIDELLAVFDCTRDNSRQYRDKDGNVAFVDNTKTLELSKDGTVSYTNTDTSSENYTKSEGIAKLYNLINKALNTVCDKNNTNDENIVVSNINSYLDETEKNVITEVSFDYKNNGCGIFSKSDKSFVTATLCNGAIKNITLKLKEIAADNETSVPNESAFTVINRFIDENYTEGSVLNISKLSLKYIYTSSGLNYHTSWIVE